LEIAKHCFDVFLSDRCIFSVHTPLQQDNRATTITNATTEKIQTPEKINTKPITHSTLDVIINISNNPILPVHVSVGPNNHVGSIPYGAIVAACNVYSH
jgi:diadenosine tetraphosphate (Ap4A) HIT family hydrolase